MKKLRNVLAIMVTVALTMSMVFSSVVFAGVPDYVEVEKVTAEYVEVVPFNTIHHSIWIDGWPSPGNVPTALTIEVLRNGRVYRGTVPRTTNPTSSANGTWGGIFAGWLHFTGVTMRGDSDCILVINIEYEVCPFITSEFSTPDEKIILRNFYY